jgi:hypothetical protein
MKAKVFKTDILLSINQTILDFADKKITTKTALSQLSSKAIELGNSTSVNRNEIGNKLGYALEFLAKKS